MGRKKRNEKRLTGGEPRKKPKAETRRRPPAAILLAVFVCASALLVVRFASSRVSPQLSKYVRMWNEEPDDPRNCQNLRPVQYWEFEDLKNLAAAGASADANKMSRTELMRLVVNYLVSQAQPEPVVIRNAPLWARNASLLWSDDYMARSTINGKLSSVKRPKEGADAANFVHFDSSITSTSPSSSSSATALHGSPLPYAEDYSVPAKAFLQRAAQPHSRYYYDKLLQQDFGLDSAMARDVSSSSSIALNPFIVPLDPDDVDKLLWQHAIAHAAGTGVGANAEGKGEENGAGGGEGEGAGDFGGGLGDLDDWDEAEEEEKEEDKEADNGGEEEEGEEKEGAEEEIAAGHARVLEGLQDDLAAAETKLWLGSYGVFTNMHYDAHHNLFRQVRGGKRFLFAPPSAWPHLNLFHSMHGSDRQSRLRFERPYTELKEQSAGLRQVQLREAAVGPGDLVYIPPFFFHFVQAVPSEPMHMHPCLNTQPLQTQQEEDGLDKGGLSVSVNTWSSSVELARFRHLVQVNAFPHVDAFYDWFPEVAQRHGAFAALQPFLRLLIRRMQGTEAAAAGFLRKALGSRYGLVKGERGQGRQEGRGARGAVGREVCWRGRWGAAAAGELESLLVPFVGKVAASLSHANTWRAAFFEQQAQQAKQGRGPAVRASRDAGAEGGGRRDKGGGLRERRAASELLLLTYLDNVLGSVLGGSKDKVVAFLQHCLFEGVA